MNTPPKIITSEALNRLSTDDKKKYLEKYHGWLKRQRWQDKYESNQIEKRKYGFKIARRKVLSDKCFYLGDHIYCFVRDVVINNGEVKQYICIYDLDEEQIERKLVYNRNYMCEKLKIK